jgi:hypothetical protein
MRNRWSAAAAGGGLGGAEPLRDAPFAVRAAPTVAALEGALGERGLALRGVFHAEPGDAGAPRLPDGRRAATVALAGQVGPSLWERFARERRVEPDPLDSWSARALGAVAAAFGAALVLPGSGPPHAPFQRWAQRAEPVRPSPLGILIHPRYGLWHAYRGALLFPDRLAAPGPQPTLESDAPGAPCAGCAAPCLSACPVGAFRGPGADAAARFDAAACAAHLASPAGAPCRTGGCLARRACPVGRGYAYGAAQQRFHLDAFLAGR